ncbi:MAG TPA: dienelactone hydrolase family protein [Candidatus Limnocylindrales bacterium]|nr:dienelactone hydrolase family protein [Candidatus Limnocylindrales bacterium]
MIEQTVEIPTADGSCTTFIAHPDRGGPHPPILFYMDSPAIREELRDMARRLASSGYYVVLPNMYYRSGVMELGPIDRTPDGPWLTRMFQLMGSINIPLVMDDTDALLAFIDTQAAAKKGRIGTLGYCMSGQYALSAAGRYPDRVAAAASIYGILLMTDAPDSPHLAVRKAKGEIYVACAEHDQWAPLTMVHALAADFREHGVNGEVEIYAGTEHGFAFPQRPIYDKSSAERHWTRLLALFSRNL